MSIIDDSYDVNKPYFQNHSYVEWLESFTVDERTDDDRRHSYRMLVRKLWSMDYIPMRKHDRDRAEEGLELRVRYDMMLARRSGLEVVGTGEMFGPCRVLEMLLALCMHMYDLMQDTDVYNSVSRWFWEIMSNVGLDDLNDEKYLQYGGDFLVEKIVGDVLSGRGRKDAKGGWFWIEKWDSRELWYQMHDYIGQYFG